MSRGYDWHGMDLDNKVFGVKGTNKVSNGVSTSVAEVLQDNEASYKVSIGTDIKVRHTIYPT